MTSRLSTKLFAVARIVGRRIKGDASKNGNGSKLQLVEFGRLRDFALEVQKVESVGISIRGRF